MMRMSSDLHVQCKKDEIFRLSQVWDKEKIWVPDGNWTHDFPLVHQSGTLTTELLEDFLKPIHLLSEYFCKILKFY